MKKELRRIGLCLKELGGKLAETNLDKILEVDLQGFSIC